MLSTSETDVTFYNGTCFNKDCASIAGMGMFSDRHNARNGWVVVVAPFVGVLQAEDITIEITAKFSKDLLLGQ